MRSYIRPTKAEKIRLGLITQMRCVACWGSSLCCGKTEAHHLNLDGKAGQKRRGHSYTVPLGKWHHQGIPLPGYTTKEMRFHFGPSLKLESKAFRERYGTDDQLLATVNANLELA